MTPLTHLLDQHILKPLGMYRDEATLLSVLKRRLTKKEYKILLANAEETFSRAETQERLSLDADRYDLLWKTLIKKINRDSIKRELFSS